MNPHNKQEFEKNNYKISVIIPVYNVERYIGKCLNSIVNQTIGIENIEVIVVNDCTPDNSMKIVKRYARDYPSIKILEHKKNLGLGSARETGLKCVTSDYISFIDSDDFISENTYEVAIKHMEKHGCDLFIYPYDHYSEEGVESAQSIHEEIFKKKGLISEISAVPEIIFATSSCNKVYSTRLSHLMKFPKTLYEDNVVSAEISFNADKIYVTDECTYFYRKRREKNSITQQKHKKKCFDLVYINNQLHDLIKDYPEHREMIEWLNLHFVDKNILDWIFVWEFSNEEIKKVFYGLKSFLKDISEGTMDNFNEYFPKYGLIRRELILDVENKEYPSFFIKWFQRLEYKVETKNFDDQSRLLEELIKEKRCKTERIRNEQKRIGKLNKKFEKIKVEYV